MNQELSFPSEKPPYIRKDSSGVRVPRLGLRKHMRRLLYRFWLISLSGKQNDVHQLLHPNGVVTLHWIMEDLAVFMQDTASTIWWFGNPRNQLLTVGETESTPSTSSAHSRSIGVCLKLGYTSSLGMSNRETWGRGWMTKASGVGERRKGRGELRRDCHHRVAALFVPTRMQQWYMIYDI